MFSAAAAADRPLYNFESEENAPKWKGLLVGPLQKVQRQVHPSLTAKDDALEYIEHLILQLLGMLCASQPHMVQDVEDRVQKTFPNPIDHWAIGDAQTALEKGKKKSPLVLPVDRIHPLLVKEVLGYKIDMQVSLYIVAVLEYIAADILKLTGNYVKNIRHSEISCQDIKVAMNADKVLMEMFSPGDEVSLSLAEEPQRRVSLTYEEMVKDLVLEEDQYIRDLNMIIKVFRQPFAKLFPRSKDLDHVFSNILDIRRLTLNLLSSLEDTIEMTEESEVPLIGPCFEELAEVEEFDIYVKYADDILKPKCRERLNILLQREDTTELLQTSGQGFKDAVKYVLPKLLLGPIYHCFHYLDVIKLLMDTTSNQDDKLSLEEAYGCLQSLKSGMERRCTGCIPKKRPAETSLSFHNHMGRPAALTKMNELQKSIDGWEGKHIGESCNEFIMEGLLNKYAGKKATERHIFLFDGLIILCKQNTRRSSVTGSVGEYRLKEKFLVRKVEIVDKEDTDELKHAFEIQTRDHASVLLSAKNAEEKNNWMAALVSLQTRSMLERMLDGILQEEERQQPLKLPPPEQYLFAGEDTEENIVFEENCDAYEAPLIRGGTLIKLIERLTYHKYFDPNFVRTFLTTYRSFCSPHDLLDYLVERFNMPEPQIDNVPADEDEGIAARDDLKRFRQVYSKPVKFRVLNVFRQWIDKHFYDFERDKDLLIKLLSFLDTVKGKAMKKGVDSIMRHIKKKEESANEEIKLMHVKSPPAIEWHLTKEPEGFDLMTLHPVEIARQVTLLEFELYRAVKPSELVGSVWIKKDKSLRSPNLLKMIHHSTMFTFWLEKCILESENIEERAAVMSRVLEIMLVFQELNNFNGVLEIVSALNSAPVFRLEHTFEEVPHKYIKAFDEAKELNSDHFKKYIEKLRSINPPCVPFLGMYLTNILLTEEGNLDFLSNRPGIINFSKRRKVAEITGEIQQYQNTPYCLEAEMTIRNFFENLDALDGKSEKEFNDYLYDKSLEIEPRNLKQAPKFPRKTEYNLKSPGIKPSSRHTTQPRSHPMPLPEPKVTNQRLQDEDLEAASSRGATPPTPSTPISPTHCNSASSDNSVFANVLINPGSSSSYTGSSLSLASSITAISVQTNSSSISASNASLVSSLQTSGYGSQCTLQSDFPEPPPIPPRKKRDSSGGDLLPNLGMSAAPVIPPRDAPTRDNRDSAPPLPPRQFSHGTLPRAHSVSIPRQTQSSSSTLPRRNSDRDHLNLNGESSERIPKVPPKTYKLQQDRVQRR